MFILFHHISIQCNLVQSVQAMLQSMKWRYLRYHIPSPIRSDPLCGLGEAACCTSQPHHRTGHSQATPACKQGQKWPKYETTVKRLLYCGLSYKQHSPWHSAEIIRNCSWCMLAPSASKTVKDSLLLNPWLCWLSWNLGYCDLKVISLWSLIPSELPHLSHLSHPCLRRSVSVKPAARSLGAAEDSCGGQNDLLAMDMAKVGDPLSIVKVCTSKLCLKI